MKKIIFGLIISTLSSCMFGNSQNDFTTSLNFYYINRLSDGSLINLPYRLLEMNWQHQNGDFEIHSNFALEHRLKEDSSYLSDSSPTDFLLDLREIYLSWYTAFGEVRFGKQINTWGMVDENSPVDNLNALDYYYIFNSGTDRKIGTFSIAFEYYLDNDKFAIYSSPIHNANRLPINDDQFPINLPVIPMEYQILQINKPWEGGAFYRRSFNRGDIMISYFRGYDRIYNLSGANLNENDYGINNSVPDTVFSYRETEVFGIGGLAFFGDLTIRGDFAFFETKDKNNSVEREHPRLPNIWTHILYSHAFKEKVKYYQYNIQLEYEFPGEIQLNFQYFKYDTLEYKAEELPIDYDIPNFDASFDSRDYFFPGMGAPIAIMTKEALLFDLSKYFFDDRLKLNLQSMIDIESEFDLKNGGSFIEFKGSLIELNCDYEISETLHITGAFLKIAGIKKLGNDYAFNQMEDFSHARIELKYFF